MRWILVFIFLYLIPLIIVFRNYNNFKRSCIYSSIYTVLVTTIVISNIYMSGLNKIEDAMYYQRYATEYIYKQKSDKTNKTNEEDISKVDVNEKEEKAQERYDENVSEVDDSANKDETKETMSSKTDMELVDSFKEDIYEIERIALIPMRDCMPYTKNISENIKKLGDIRKDLEYAKDKCNEAIKEYEKMEIPNLSKEDYTLVLDEARNDLIKTYELREKAMEDSLNLVDTKNPKYIGRVTEYLKLSDNHITSFKDRINDLKENIDNSNEN